MSYVDSLVIHDLDLGYGTREQVEGYLSELESGGRALAELRAAGTVKAFGAGCNMFSPEQQCDEFARRIAKLVDLDFFLIAGAHYTLLDQEALDVQMPIMDANDMTAVVGTPLAQGRLARGQFYGEDDLTPTALKVQELQKVCESEGVDIKAAALQFPLAHPRVVSIIPGSANAEEAAQNKALLDTDLPKNLWRKFKEAGLVRAEAPMPGDSNASM